MINKLLYMFGMREKVVLQVTIGFMHCCLNFKNPKFKDIILISDDCGYQNGNKAHILCPHEYIGYKQDAKGPP